MPEGPNVILPILAQFIQAVPYAVAIVELDDARNTGGSPTRIGGAVVDAADDVASGLPTEIASDDHPSQPFEVRRIKLSEKTAPGLWWYGG